MKKLISIFFICIFFKNFVQAQDEYKWGVVDTSFLKMKRYDLDTNANAIILLDKGVWEIQPKLVNVYNELFFHRRMKFFNNKAFDTYGHVTIPYKYKNFTEEIKDIAAIVIHPNGMVDVLDKSKIYNEIIDDEYAIYKFIFPGLAVGDVVEYKYTKISNQFSFLGPWYFQEPLPVLHSELSFLPPESYEYEFLYSGTYKPKQQKWNDGGIQLMLDSIPALSEEEVFVTTPKDYCANVSFQLAKYVSKDGKETSFLSSWRDLGKSLEIDPFFGNRYHEVKEFSKAWKALQPLLENAKNDNEKVEIIYNFVNDHVKWNEIFQFWCTKALNEVFKVGKGSSSEINLLMIALLRQAGIKALPMLISTRDNGKVSENYPFLQSFNHVLCLVQLGNNKFILDGGNELRPVGVPKSVSLVKRGFVVEGIASRWENIPAHSFNHFITVSNFEMDENGTLLGSMTFNYQHYAAVDIRERNKNGDFIDEYKKMLVFFYPEIQVDSVKTENLLNLKQGVKIQVFCKIPNAAMISGDLIYFKPFAISNFDDNPFKAKERNFPVDMLFSIKEQSVLNLILPKGYEVEFLPKSTAANLLDKAANTQYISENANQKIKINFTTQFNQTTFMPNDYNALRDFYGSIVAKLEEQIVLKKLKK